MTLELTPLPGFFPLGEVGDVAVEDARGDMRRSAAAAAAKGPVSGGGNWLFTSVGWCRRDDNAGESNTREARAGMHAE